MREKKRKTIRVVAIIMSFLLMFDSSIISAIATTIDNLAISENSVSESAEQNVVLDETTAGEIQEIQETSENITDFVGEEDSEDEIIWEDTSDEVFVQDEVETLDEEELNAEGVAYSGSTSYMNSVYYQRLQAVQLTGDQRVDIVNIAKSQVGYYEGSNSNSLGGNVKTSGNYTEYGRVQGSNPNPWCAYFVAWCARRAGVSTGVIANSSTANWERYKTPFHKRGDGYTPRPGDLVFYKYKGSTAKYAQHVELVVGVDSTKIYTVGGNTSDMVKSYSTKRTSTDIVGYGVPNYPSVVPVATNPSISYADISNGKQITLSAPDCSIYYSLDGAGYLQYSYPISVTSGGNHTISAYSTRSGYTTSTVISSMFSVPQVPMPSISTKDTPTGTIVTLADSLYGATISYSLNGGGYRNYTGPFTLTSTASIQVRASANGYAVNEAVSKTVTISKPVTPKLSLGNVSNKISVRDKAIVMWEEIANAANYTVKIYKGEEFLDEISMTANSLSYTFPEKGNYSFEIMASNNWGDSDYSPKLTVEAMDDVKVQFLDWDDSPLSEEYTIKYGDSVTAPKAPSRVGYDFQTWSSGFEKITKDTIIKALYEKKSFQIVFHDQDGTVCKTERVEWDDAATPPDMSEKAAVGYKFSGWYVDPQNSDWEDYTKVEGKMNLYATYSWENENLPIVIRDVKTFCTYNNTDSNTEQFYTTTMNLFCSPTEDVWGRVIVEIKTTKGTTVAIATQNVTIKAGETQIPLSVQVNSKSDGVVANVYIVGLDETGEKTTGALSKVATCAVEREVFYSDWSEWSTTKPTESDQVVIEEKKQYRYNTKLTTTNSDGGSIAGYTYSYKDTHVGSWSNWVDYPISSIVSNSLTRDVSMRDVPTSTSYLYGHYCTGNLSGAKYQTCDYKFDSRCSYHSIGWFSEGDGQIVDRPDVSGGYYYYPSSTKYRCSNTCYTWYRMETSHTYKTQYCYRDTTYTYHYYKITDYTDWSDYAPTGNYYSLDTRTVYRYKTVTDENKAKEKEEATPYTIEGKLSDTETDLSGRIATVMVYKKTNTDPTQNQMEYLDQIIIGEQNSYSFTVRPKEEISANTGDYIVSLALEGATSLINAYVIPAPRASYSVKFIADGKVISEQSVEAGNSAEIPNAPVISGEKFIKWDRSATNVNEDLVINAIYDTIDYVVVYIDEMNHTIQLERANYNDAISKELPQAPEGYVCTGWDKGIVTGDMIVKALFERPTYNVIFVDVDGQPVSEQKVKYGNTALPPDVSYMIAPENTKIVGWSRDVEWWSVKADITVYPVVEYTKTVDTPYCDTALSSIFIAEKDFTNNGDELSSETVSENDVEGLDDKEYPIVTLCTETADAEIYYTTDGSDPSIGSSSTKKYTQEGIVLYGTTQIKAIGVAEDMNPSEVSELNFEVEEVVTADGYDHENDIEIDLSQGLPEGTEEVQVGDVNGDGVINNKDVAYLAKYLVGTQSITDTQMESADVNGDGFINNKDVAKLSRYLVGKETLLGA